ncbi:hypothetical protein [Chroogloeocystis siderophila]|uniref:DUF4398 domain-containing protein n=1 Tax=Chroogloeocystis siderophila 5.2 s.c.1 TaxID=247279 RepID=A0A1U7I002_9CHRO|nr:hypothetical protein [Chroogloeocystis siderophila]OKH29150.1 hypothetical protein NIES1031_00670 [Chroogloeocystis siderophila 5.2 s.c.1]
MRKTLVLATLLAISGLSATATPGITQSRQKPRPASPTAPAQPGVVLPSGRGSQASLEYRQVERAGRDIARAREDSYRVSYLARQVSSSQANELLPIAQQIMERAESNFRGGQYFEASEQAKAAAAIYDAAENLYEGELGYVVGKKGPSGPSRSYIEAPQRAQERIARTEAEIQYYRSNDNTVRQLLDRAKMLVANAATPAANASAIPVTNTYNFAYLAQNRAADRLLRAAMHLIAAERGF